MKVEPYPICKSCLQGKMIENSFKVKGVRATGFFEFVHTDVCGVFNHITRGGFLEFFEKICMWRLLQSEVKTNKK